MLVVFAVISIVLGLAFLALIAAGLGTDAVNAMDPNDPDLVAGIAVGLVLGVVLVGSGVVDLVVGALGLRGARDPRKVKPFFVLCVIGLAIEVAGDLDGQAADAQHDRGVSASFHSSVKAVDPSTAFTISHQISSPG